jgi:hypothetical protein
MLWNAQLWDESVSIIALVPQAHPIELQGVDFVESAWHRRDPAEPWRKLKPIGLTLMDRNGAQLFADQDSPDVRPEYFAQKQTKSASAGAASLSGDGQMHSVIVTVLPAIGEQLGQFRFTIKNQCPALANDSDVPTLPACDNALLAYTLGDMLQDLRQYTKANAMFAEAQAHVQTMTNAALNQKSNPQVLLPDDGDSTGRFNSKSHGLFW